MGACKVIAEGHRTYKDIVDGTPLKLLQTDAEGHMIQGQGVHALIYGAKLWGDKPALMALMREHNANADVAKPETELDAFGTVHQVVTDATQSGNEPTVLKEDDIMELLAAIGFGNIPVLGWRGLARFRIYLPGPHAGMLLDTSWHVVNGRVKTMTEN